MPARAKILCRFYERALAIVDMMIESWHAASLAFKALLKEFPLMHRATLSLLVCYLSDVVRKRENEMEIDHITNLWWPLIMRPRDALASKIFTDYYTGTDK